VAWYPSLIQCKYELGVLLVEECRCHEALPYATYIINHLFNYKWAYDLKARALTGLGKLPAALNIYDEVLLLAPNYCDAHIGRLALLSKLVQDQREEERAVGVERFLVAYKSAGKIDPKMSDKVDDEVRRLFQMESHQDIEMQSVATRLPEPHVIDLQTCIQKLLDQGMALTRLVEETKLNTREFKAENVKLHTQMDKEGTAWTRLVEELKADNVELHAKMIQIVSASTCPHEIPTAIPIVYAEHVVLEGRVCWPHLS
jgi:tetratricopeptide (TPR) repeat protein